MSRNTAQWLDSADINRAVERLRRRGEGVLTAAKRGLKEGVDIVIIGRGRVKSFKR